jgi:hypothetical protein
MEGKQLEFDFIKKEEKSTTRKVSIVVEIKDIEKAGWIWDSHIKENLDLGIRVSSISNGDTLAKLNKLENILNTLETKNAIEYDHLEEFDSLMEEYESL